MFDFFRKRIGRAASNAARVDPVEPAAIAEVSVSDREIALARVAELADDEPAAVDFILQCEFADARLLAAEHVYSRPMVERVLQAMRNSDRRVVKLMQGRLDYCRQWEADEQQANHCITQARQLVSSPHLTPNQVADLDRAWQKIQHVAPPLQHTFDNPRSRLQQRLAEQADLQRRVLDALAQVRNWMSDDAFVVSADAMQQLSVLEQQVVQQRASAEAASLPKNLLPEFAQAVTDLRQALLRIAQSEEGIAARRTLLAQWEAAAPASLTEAAIMQAWRAAPALPDQRLIQPLQARLDMLLLQIKQSHIAQQDAGHPVNPDLQNQFAAGLARLEQALQEGALQAAAEQDRVVRSLDQKLARPSAEQTANLTRLRAELVRLQGWARWGGNVSREELLHAAMSLPAQSLAVAELARKVGSLRERWKSLDISAGPAGKDLWQRFDLACTAAYAPAAAHFKQLADERARNAAKAQTLIDECSSFASAFLVDGSEPEQLDWKAAATFLDRMRQAWRQLGTLDRKDKKRLDLAFDAALDRLAEPLAAQRSREVAQREKLIAEAANLNPQERGTLDAVRDLQERWQQHSRAMPLERRQEQQLWQRFREQCDTVFAKRKEVALAADTDRRQHLAEKTALCARLEAAQSGPDTSIRQLLRDTRTAWNQIGSVAHAAERAIEDRYRQAEQSLQRRLEDAKRHELAACLQALQIRLHSCQALEQLLATMAAVPADQLMRAQNEWAGLASAGTQYEDLLQTRFAAAITAAQAQDRDYALSLESQRGLLLDELLRLEILSGLDSPAEFSRRRLQLQVAGLQSSLKTGQKQPVTNESEQLSALCRLPALIDQQTSQRIERILDWYKSGKAVI